MDVTLSRQDHVAGKIVKIGDGKANISRVNLDFYDVVGNKCDYYTHEYCTCDYGVIEPRIVSANGTKSVRLQQGSAISTAHSAFC